MTPTDLLELFRLETDDISEPYLWSDKEFYTYLNEAQNIFVREIGGLSDRRSNITKVSYKTGDKYKKYDASILRIKGAQDEENRFVGIRNFDNLEAGQNSDDYGQRYPESFDDGLTGSIKFLITDIEAKDFQLYPLPDHDGTLQLFVQRLPLQSIKDEDSVLEIAEQYHLDLLSWVKYKSFLKQDVETFDGTKAADFRSMFADAIEIAKKEKSAREDRKRIVRYGGI